MDVIPRPFRPPSSIWHAPHSHQETNLGPGPGKIVETSPLTQEDILTAQVHSGNRGNPWELPDSWHHKGRLALESLAKYCRVEGRGFVPTFFQLPFVKTTNRSECSRFPGSVISARLNMRVYQRAIMSGPEKLGNPAIPSPQVAGTRADLADDTQDSTRIPQGFDKPTTRIPQGFHMDVPGRSQGCHKKTTAGSQDSLRLALSSYGASGNRPPRKQKHENHTQRRNKTCLWHAG